MKKSVSKFFKVADGASAVEFALVMPLVIGLGLGSFETGLAMYERSELNEAAVAGTRAVALYGNNDAEIIRVARSQLPANLRDVAEITVTDTSFDGQPFKRIDVNYDHDLMISFTRAIESYSLTASRFAPVLTQFASSAGPGSGTNTGPTGSSGNGNCNASATANISISVSGSQTSTSYSSSASACGQTNTTSGGRTASGGQNVNTSVSAGGRNR